MIEFDPESSPLQGQRAGFADKVRAFWDAQLTDEALWARLEDLGAVCPDTAVTAARIAGFTRPRKRTADAVAELSCGNGSIARAGLNDNGDCLYFLAPSGANWLAEHRAALARKVQLAPQNSPRQWQQQELFR